MKHFIHEDFLLQSEAARTLYHDYASGLPIIDYHCHLPPDEIARNQNFANLTSIWLAGDHYKWRAMRANGLPERLITGDASDREKFDAWASTVPRTIRNPLYHWTHMELADPFGIRDRLLSPDSASFVWDACNEQLATTDFTPCGILHHFNVEVVCTTDDPTDSLEHHAAIANGLPCSTRVYPTFRPDNALAIDKPAAWNLWLEKLGALCNRELKNFDDLIDALEQRAKVFHAHGCRLSDHGLEEPYADSYRAVEIGRIFSEARGGFLPDRNDIRLFRSALLYRLGLLYHELGWTQQYHIGPIRNLNTRAMKSIGANTGYDSIGDAPMASGLARMLDRLDADGRLSPTVIYNLNPADNEVFAAMAGNFQEGPKAGKIQYGSGWWFMDQKSGIERQLDALGNMGLLSRFVGMLTDSRSFLSYPRHDYFRRVLCNLLGGDIEQGLLPRDFPHIGGIVTDICYNNAKDYFNFPEGTVR